MAENQNQLREQEDEEYRKKIFGVPLRNMSEQRNQIRKSIRPKELRNQKR